jgi:hypothetical protein
MVYPIYTKTRSDIPNQKKKKYYYYYFLVLILITLYIHSYPQSISAYIPHYQIPMYFILLFSYDILGLFYIYTL